MSSQKDYCFIYIVRHGETDWNTQGIIQGQLDTPLNRQGEQQARDVGEMLQGITFDAVFSSDLVRAKRTAEIIALERKLEVKTTQLLREQHFGRFQGRPRQEFLKLFVHWNELSEAEKFSYTVADEESNEQAVSRMLTFLREASLANIGKTILVVAHGALMRYLLIKLGEATFSQPKFMKNAGYIKLHSDGIEFFVDQIVGVEERRKTKD
ncbi:MAG TPA: histidine phosphatase family protein [Patescibacteria group bacterium]|nr:histidine phosphatase family protein [Patescibacteria group bacterium]